MEKENPQYRELTGPISQLVETAKAIDQKLVTVEGELTKLSAQVKLLVDQKTPKPDPKLEPALAQFRSIRKALGLE